MMNCWQCPHCMWSRVYEMVQCPSICLSRHGPKLKRSKLFASGLLLWARWAGDIDQLLQQRRANAGSATLSAYVCSWTQSCCCCRESERRSISQSPAWYIRSSSRPLHWPDGVIHSSVHTQRLREGDVETAGVMLRHCVAVFFYIVYNIFSCSRYAVMFLFYDIASLCIMQLNTIVVMKSNIHTGTLCSKHFVHLLVFL